MPKISEGQYALGFLTFVAVWLFVFLPLLHYPAQQAPQVHAQQHSDSALKGQQNAEGGPQQTAKANEEHGGKHPKQSENEGTEFWPAFLGIRLKITDSLLALFTAGLLIFTGLLWKSTEKLWAETRDTGRRQETDTRILQRAYLSVEPFGVHPMKQVAKYSIPHIQISNVGKLPAKQVRWLIHHAACEDHDRKVFRIDEGDAKGGITLAPGVTMQQGGDLVDVETELKLGFGWYLYVWGAAYYADGFGENRVTKFCHRYNCVNTTQVVSPGADLASGYGIEASFARYNRWGNDAT